MIYTRIFKTLFMLFACSLTSLSAQEFNPFKNVTYPSPTAIQFQKYVDIPVGNYTGTTPVNVNLYTINAVDINVPITLMYHTSGVRITEHASWVGAGWSLSAGGLISRTVNGLPDFEVYVNDLNETFTATSDGNENQPAPGTATMNEAYYDSPQVPTTAGTGQIGYMDDIMQSKRDGQPDVYYYHFLGRSGKFFIDQNENVIQNPQDKIRISKPTSFEPYWVITDNAGTKYFFGSTSTSKEYSIGFKDVEFVSGWYLTKIQSRNGNEVIFNYNQASSFTFVPLDRTYDFQTEFNFTSGSSGSTTLTYAKRNQFKPVWLTSIVFDSVSGSGIIDFYSSQDRQDSFESGSYLAHRRLYRILVKDASHFRLYRYDLAHNNHANNLWLTKITKRYFNDAGSAIEISDPPYQFTYHKHTDLPNDKTYSIDYWGYYNAKSNGTTLLPKKSYSTTGSFRDYSSGADRSAVLDPAKHGALTQVEYPEGATLELEYELNEWSNFSLNGSTNSQGAGLRISRLALDPGLGAPEMVTEYGYVYLDDVTKSSGRLLAPMFNGANVQKHWGASGYDRADIRTTHPLNLGGHQAVGYDVMSIFQGTNGDNGRKNYVYKNVAAGMAEQLNKAGHQNELLIAPYYFNSNLNGLLEQVYINKKSGSWFLPIKRITYQYTLHSDALPLDGFIAAATYGTQQAGGINAKLTEPNFIGKPWTDVAGYLSYNMNADWYSLSQIRDRHFEFPSRMDKVTDITRHTQTPRELQNYIAEQKVTYPNGKVLETHYTYPFNTTGTVYTNMTSDHIQPVVSETSFFKDGTTYKHVGGSTREYAMISSVSGSNSITRPLLSKLYEHRQESLSTAVANKRLVREITQYTYDFGRVEEEKDANGVYTSYIWHENILLAKVYNANRLDVYYNGFEYDTASHVGTGDGITGNKYTTSFSGPPAIGAGANYMTYWKKVGSTWTYFSQAYLGGGIAGSDRLDDIRIMPKDALMTTYTYIPLGGYTSESDANNRPTFFSYDSRKRLELIKDLDGNPVVMTRQGNPTN